MKHDKNSFIEKATRIHGNKYDYSVVDYKNNKTPIKIICLNHGIFEQRPDNHLHGYGCIKCSGRYVYSNKEFIEKAIETHGDKYDYSSVNYKNNSTKIKIICLKHGVFEQRPIDHKRGRGCPSCNSSLGEEVIKLFLEKNKIKFVQQKRFDDCRNIKPLPFDFYIEDCNLCIEYDGSLHYIQKDYFGGEKELTKRIKNDKIKNEYCNKNKIKILRIPYWDFERIESLLEELIV